MKFSLAPNWAATQSIESPLLRRDKGLGRANASALLHH